jgi:hypothetical protein
MSPASTSPLQQISINGSRQPVARFMAGLHTAGAAHSHAPAWLPDFRACIWRVAVYIRARAFPWRHYQAWLLPGV